MIANDLEPLDLLAILDDSSIRMQHPEAANAVNLELSMMHHELHSVPVTVATDYLATMIRASGCDLERLREQTSKKLRAIDVVLGDCSTEDCDDLKLLRAIHTQTSRIERLLCDEAQHVQQLPLTVTGTIDPQAYYGYEEAAKLLGVSASTLYRRKVEGTLKSVAFGRRVKFLGSQLLSLTGAEETAIQVLSAGL